jgi:D-amino-acid dehydrogenase
MSASDSRDIVIIGAGVVGVACARWLQRDGHRVLLLDEQPPGHGCSWGNAGTMAADTVLPVATPRTLLALPRMLADPTGPLAVRWSYLPRMAPWFARFLWNARPGRVRANAAALASLCAQAIAGYEPITQGRPAGERLAYTGWVSAFEKRKALEGARWEVEQKQRFGVPAEWLDAAGLRERVPQLAEHVVGGVWFPDTWMVTDPADFVTRLATDAVDDGGRIEQVRVERIVATGDGVRIETRDGARTADHAVVATGAHTRPLARSLGDDFPLDTERGYHAMLPNPGIRPPMPVMAGDHKFVTTPMEGGVRLAGTAELAGLERPPDRRRAEILVERAQRLFPGLRADGWTDWMGFRPTLPDSLPVVGRSPRTPAVTYAFGHQHLGLTLAGITGRLVADDLAGREPPLDPSPLRPDRFQAGSHGARVRP